MSSIQFSYPQMSGALTPDKKKIQIVNSGGSYFDLIYTIGQTTTVLHFIPTALSFANDYLIIDHTGTGGNTLKIRFKIGQSDNAKHGITPSDMYINQLIGDGLEKDMKLIDKKIKIGLDSSMYTIDFASCGKIPIKTLDKTYSSGGAYTEMTQLQSIEIPLTSNTFITDEIVCNEGINNSTDAATKTYEAKVAGNVGLSFGLGFLVLTAVVALIAQNQYVLQFTGSVSLFNMEGPTDTIIGDKSDNKSVWRKGYVGFYTVAFLLSFSCFMGYGGVLSSGSGSTADLTGLLWTAIVSFLIFVFMVGYKMAVLTKPAAGAQ